MAEIGGTVEIVGLIICGINWLLPVFLSQLIPGTISDALLTWIEQPLAGVLIIAGIVRTHREL